MQPHPIPRAEDPSAASRLCRLLARQLTDHDIRWHAAGQADRAPVEALIRQRFASAYGAQVSQFLPYLLSVRQQDTVTAALGVRLADAGPLFLETYLDQPVEQCLAAATRGPVVRSGIVEIGNLAAEQATSSLLLFLALGNLLQAAGLRWLVFSATPLVSAMVAKLHLRTHLLAEADPARLGDQRAPWGHYYDCHPQVVAADLQSAFTHDDTCPGMTPVKLLAPIGEALAPALRAARQPSSGSEA